MVPDASVGVDGWRTSYLKFDIAGAERLDVGLDTCIAEYCRLGNIAKTGTGPSTAP